jgi:putative membrane protein insertion efficiency factor
MNPLTRLVLGVLRAYKTVVSPLLGPRCKYYPSCSDYAALAIQRYGILRGLVLSGWRLMRCNPLSRGGVDLVEDQRLFKTSGRAASA